MYWYSHPFTIIFHIISLSMTLHLTVYYLPIRPIPLFGAEQHVEERWCNKCQECYSGAPYQVQQGTKVGDTLSNKQTAANQKGAKHTSLPVEV